MNSHHGLIPERADVSGHRHDLARLASPRTRAPRLAARLRRAARSRG